MSETAGPAAASCVALRPAQPADIADIAAIYGHYVLTGLASFEETPPSEDEMARRMESIAASGLPYLVALCDGAFAGYGYASRYRDRSAYRYTVEDSIYIAPAMTGRGFGRTLLGALIEACAERGMRQMVAVIGDSANVTSIGLHSKLGFRVAGVLPSSGFKFGRWVDTVLMTRPLGDGDRTPPAR